MTRDTQEQDADQHRVMDALAGLGARDRQVLEMLKLRELSLKEAEAETGLSISALKVASFRAMQRLKQALKGGSDEN